MRTLLPILVLLASAGMARAQGTAAHLTAEQAVALALENNHGVRMARNSAEMAKSANSAGSAGMLPTLDANGGYSMDNAGTEQAFFTGEVRETDNANAQALNAQVELNWTLFDGLSMFAAKDRLETLERIGEGQLRQTMEATVYGVLANYFQLVQLEKAVAVQRESLQTSRERLLITGTGERAGTASGLDLVQAQLDLSTDSAQLLALLQQTATARAALNTLLARPPATPLEVDTLIPAGEPLDLPTLQQAALSANTALQLAREEHLAADLSVKELRGTLLPKLDGFANYGWSRTTSDVGFLMSNQRLGPQYGLTLSVPLFRGGAIRAVKQAQLYGAQLGLAEDQARLELDRDLLDVWNQYGYAAQRVQLEEANLAGARTQMQVALESYRIGVITAVQLRDVQQGLVTAENRLLTARFEAKVAELQLRLLAGKLL